MDAERFGARLVFPVTGNYAAARERGTKKEKKESASTYFVDADCYCGIHAGVYVLLLVVTEEVCPLEDTVDVCASLRVVPMLEG